MPNSAWSLRRAACAAAAGPADRPLDGVAHDRRLVGQAHHVVEHHRHVAAQGFLDGHGPLGRNGHQPAVDVGAENGLLLGHLDETGQAEELEAAAIGEDWPVPAHEPMQPPQGRHGLLARPQGQVIGVRQDHLAPRRPESARPPALSRSPASPPA